MEKKLATARTLAWIFGILLVIAAIVIWNDHRTIANLEAPGKQNITAQKDVIRQDCTASDPESRLRCADDLQQLSDLLGQFSRQQKINTSASGQLPTK